MKTKLTNTRQIILATICAATLSNAALAGPHRVQLSDWDADGNNSVSLKEWQAALEAHDVFKNIDENNNGIFDIEEAAESEIDYDMSMDIDRGGHIDRHEFAIGTFSNLDKNDDDKLDNTEFMGFSNNLVDADLLSSN